MLIPPLLIQSKQPFTIAEVADGAEALAAAEVARAMFRSGADLPALALMVTRDAVRAQAIEQAFAFFAPEIELFFFPAWDCQPYDRASPSAGVLARRMGTLSRLVRSRGGDRPRVVLTTANALVQRLPPVAWVSSQALAAAPGNALDMDDLTRWLEHNGFTRTATVRDAGEYAVRGGIVDLYAPSLENPIRLDFFGDTLETIRSFDPETQRTIMPLAILELIPTSELQMTTEAIRRFRQGYVAAFGAATKGGDMLYEAVSEGRRYPGMEHWLPLFHDGLSRLTDYTPGAAIILDHLALDAARERLSQARDYYQSRRSGLEAIAPGSTPYKPLPPEALYWTEGELASLLPLQGGGREGVSPHEPQPTPTPTLPLAGGGGQTVTLTPFALPDGGATKIVSLGARQGRNFAAERAAGDVNVFDAAVTHVRERQKAGKRVLLAAWTDGSRDRLAGVMADHGLKDARPVASLAKARELKEGETGLAILPVETGFELPDMVVLGEQDILGERLMRGRAPSKRAKDFIAEVSSLSVNDVVVHVDHGIGRFVGLQTVTALGSPHDCLELHYANGDKLFLPVENIELLSRYGGEDTEVSLDRLGGGSWQARKAKLKKRILDMAKQLIKIAAARMLREAPKLAANDNAYQDFVARFPYEPTDDQQNAIDATLDDLAAGRPMDRLICGDVGFGKTEVALRAAYACAMSGKQVAVVVPTTLLSRQHYKTFSERFRGLPVQVAQASRMVGSAELSAAKKGVADGTVDIVVGTHALLGKSVQFKDLGLVIVDEEQHFGVAHKERLKDLRAEVHVLTLSATPIPRTLQLALTGVRELSIIATPPVDRLAVRTFVAPFDPMIVREALLRERYRGGKSFYVVPRIEDLADVKAFLDAQVPEIRYAVGHGQMAPTELDEIMNRFYEGKFDVLLSTTIVESGLDIPSANTLIVHRADMFGLGQLYQLRGRVGRGKTRAYALLTLPASKPVTAGAEKRLKVLQSLDSLGAGFQLASHDLDIRGAGNLLGDEQSGHIKEVGYELYQQMLEEAVANLKAGIEEPEDEPWTPTIVTGAPVLIPESYVADLDLRMGLYRRLSTLQDDADIEGFAAELIDRFGPLPPEVEQLLGVMAIKTLCRRANIEKVEAGPKGIVVVFRGRAFANPEGLVRFVAERGSFAKVRQDMSVVFIGDYEKPTQRLRETRRLLRDLVAIAETKRTGPSSAKPEPAKLAPTKPQPAPARPAAPPAARRFRRR
jgi:transcription-repair coupling factor (superfamily II helicase)